MDKRRRAGDYLRTLSELMEAIAIAVEVGEDQEAEKHLKLVCEALNNLDDDCSPTNLIKCVGPLLDAMPRQNETTLQSESTKQKPLLN